MFNISPKIVEVLMADQELVEDFDEVATRCLVGLQQNIADLNTFLLTTRGRKVTDKRREMSTQLISNMIFYVALLLHLNDLPPDMFDMSNDSENGIVHVTEEFNESFFHSPLLLGTFLMGTAVEMGQLMWDEDFSDEMSLEPVRERATVEAQSTPLEIPDDKTFDEFMAVITGGAPDDHEHEIDEWDDVEFDIDTKRQEELFDVFENFLAGVMIMADLCDIDLGVCMYNASVQTEI